MINKQKSIDQNSWNVIIFKNWLKNDLDLLLIIDFIKY